MRLREDTRVQHERAESAAFEQALFRGTLPRELYVAMLAQRFVIHRVLEAAIREAAPRVPTFDVLVTPELLQAENLRADLAFFGFDADTAEPCPAAAELIAAIESAAREQPAALLGFYYVFEGSKNGARIISERVRQAYDLTGSDGTRYLDPHGAAQRELWRQFRDRMDAVPLSPEQADAVIAAARLTFDCVTRIGTELLEQHTAAA